MWQIIQLVIFIITSLPKLIKSLKEIWDLMQGDKASAKSAVNALCEGISCEIKNTHGKGR